MINLDKLNNIGESFIGKNIISIENKQLIKELIKPFYNFKSKEIWYEINLEKDGPDYIFRITESEKLIKLSKKMLHKNNRKWNEVWERIYLFSLQWNIDKKEDNNYIKSISFEFDYEEIKKIGYSIPCIFIEIDDEKSSGKANDLYENILKKFLPILYEGHNYKNIFRNLVDTISNLNNLTSLWQIGFMYSRNDTSIRVFTNIIKLNDSLKLINKYNDIISNKVVNEINYFKHYFHPDVILDFNIDEKGCKIDNLLGLNVHIDGFNNMRYFLKQLYNDKFINSDYIEDLVKWYGKSYFLDEDKINNLIQRDIAHFKIKISPYNHYNMKMYLRAEIIGEYGTSDL